jgi:hypothetical protein
VTWVGVAGFEPVASSSRTSGGAGGWPLFQLTEGVGDGSSWLLPGAVAVLGCYIVTAHTVQGMARVRSGQAPAWPLSSDRSVRRGSGVKRDFACTFTRHFPPVLVVPRS